MKTISIIILNWQSWRDTLTCLDSLKKLTYAGSISIIVCDNGSEDESFPQILKWAQQHYAPSEISVFYPGEGDGAKCNNNSPFTIHHSPFTIIQTGANLGFAGGNNVGLCYALANQPCEYIWLLNNDTVVDTHALAALSKYATIHPQVALLGSTIIDYYQRDTVQCAGGCYYFPMLTVFKYVLGGQPLDKVMQTNETINFDYVYGAAMFFKVEALRKVGLLNEEYFLFYEELDYTQRLKPHGYDIGWCKDSFVYHKGSASVGSTHEGNRDKLCRANYYENLSTLKYTANFHKYLLPIIMIVRFLGKSLALIRRGDFYLFAPLLKAYRDFMFLK